MQLDPDQLKRIEDDLQIKNEITAKKMKEQEMLRNQAQFTNVSHPLTTGAIKQFNEVNKYQQAMANNENVFKMPPPITPKYKNVNQENSNPLSFVQSMTP